MARRRVRARFFIYIALIVGLGYFGYTRYFATQDVRVSGIYLGSTQEAHRVEGMVARSEQVIYSEGYNRVDFVAAEGANVRKGDAVAYIYTAAYSQKEMDKLEQIRQDIRYYHNKILQDIADRSLQQLENNVEVRALDFKKLALNRAAGSLVSVENQLETAMKQRQDYLRANMREDTKLQALYESEQKQLSNIASWRTAFVAPEIGIVSFYLDGYEGVLDATASEAIAAEDVRTMLGGRKPAAISVPRGMSPLYRLVDGSKWYIYTMSGEKNWTPVADQVYRIRVEGYEDVVYEARVDLVNKLGNDTIARLVISTPIGPLFNTRFCGVILDYSLSGLRVPVGAMTVENGLDGVRVNDISGGSFVPVDILTREGDYILVRPQIAGTLNENSVVILLR